MFDEGTILEGNGARYEIVKELSMGEFAVAYKARDLGSGRDVFVKKYIDPTPLLKDEYAAFTGHQRRVNALLNTLGDDFEKILDDFEFAHHYHVVKPFLAAESLEHWLGAAQPAAAIHAVATGLARILVQLEQAGIVHFDLKPPQVMVFPDGPRPVLCDFDFSVLLGPNPSRAHKAAMTPFYFAPEHLKRDLGAFTFATNAFLMGLVLFELFTRGVKPHLADDVPAYEEAIKAHRVRRLREVLPAAPADVDELLFKALDPDPARRPAPAEFVRVLAAGPLPVPAGAPVYVEAGAAPPAAARRVELKCGESLPLSVWQSTVIGRDDLRIFGDERKFAEKKQFRIFPEAGGWMIEEQPGTTNRTRVNGAALGDAPVPLAHGAEIQVGPLKLRVSHTG